MSHRIKEIIILTANYYQRTLNLPILEMYLEDLEGFDEEKVIAGYKKYRRDPKNKTFPLPAQIIATMHPEISVEAQALEIAGRIRQAVEKFGYVGAVKAQEFIGEIGWSVVQRFGSWPLICEQHGVQIRPDMFFAQTRDMIKAKIEIDRAGGVNDSSLLEFKNKPDAKALTFEPIFSPDEVEKLSKELAHLSKAESEEFLSRAAEQRIKTRRDENEAQSELNRIKLGNILGDINFRNDRD